MKIVWDSYREQWCVVEDETEIGRFDSLLLAEAWVIQESERREKTT